MMTATFLCYLVMVMPFSSLSIHVTGSWGYTNFLAGLVAGASFITTLFLRKRAGDLADRMGGRHCFIRGCLWYVASACLCLLAGVDCLPVPVRFALLLAGRALAGVGESLNNVGMAQWAIGMMGVERTGRILATYGMCNYGAVAVGGQFGFSLYRSLGLSGLFLVCALAASAAFVITRLLPGDGHVFNPGQYVKASFPSVMARIWRLSLPASMHGIGFAVLAAFVSQSFMERGWPYAGSGLTFWGVGFVVMRLVIGHLPDKIGGLRVAFASGMLEAVGLLLLWLMAGPESAMLGCFLTGAGMSMIFPSLASVLAKANPPSLRGVVLSCNNIFIDISYGFAGPVAGLFTDYYGDRIAYLFALLASFAGVAMVGRRIRRK